MTPLKSSMASTRRDPGVSGNPTNRGIDPYVLATRGPDGWSTSYVGISADAPSAAPFSSSLQGADAGLDSFTFAGPERSATPASKTAAREFLFTTQAARSPREWSDRSRSRTPFQPAPCKKPFSSDGSHLIFGSKQAFETGANDNNTNVTIYSRNLKSATTEIASTGPSGNALADGSNVAELDVSNDGSRVSNRRPRLDRYRRKPPLRPLHAYRGHPQLDPSDAQRSRRGRL